MARQAPALAKMVKPFAEATAHRLLPPTDTLARAGAEALGAVAYGRSDERCVNVHFEAFIHRPSALTGVLSSVRKRLATPREEAVNGGTIISSRIEEEAAA